MFKGILLAAALATLGQAAQARDITYAIKDGLPAVVSISDGAEQHVTVRVANGPVQQLGTFDDDAIDQVESVDIDHDGYLDLTLGQSGGSSQLFARLFLYRPKDGTFQEIQHPGQDSPCRQFVNPVIAKEQAAISVACRFGAASNGAEEYVLRPDGTVRATTWSTQALFDLETDQAELTYHFREDGTIDRIDINGDGSPLDSGTVPVSKLDLYDAPDVNSHPSMTAAEGEALTVIALRPHGWLQVRYASKTASGDVIKWVRHSDLRVDKYQYQAGPPPADGLDLTLFNYLGDWDDESGGRYTVRLDNRGTAAVSLASPRLWLLLINARGDRITHPLYARDAVTLGAADTPGQAAMVGWADDPIVWRKDEDGTYAYMVNDNGYRYVRLVPDLAPGKYRAAVIVTDPGGVARPIYSNEVRFDFPFPKRAASDD